MKILQRN